MKVVSFEEFNKKEKDLEDYKKTILKCIDDFILLDRYMFGIRESIIDQYNSAYDYYYDHNFNDRFTLLFTYSDYRTYDLLFTHNQYKKLLEFMKDPELYKNSNKYNL